MKKKWKSFTIIIGLWLATIIVIEIISTNPRDAVSEIPPKPPPIITSIHTNLSKIIQQKQPKLDPIITKRITKSIEKYAKKFNLPPELVLCIIDKESTFKPTAVSKAGCKGLMQINPVAHPEKLKKLNVKGAEIFYIDNNIHLGCIILFEYYKKTKSITKSLYKYLGANNKKYVNDILSEFSEILVRKEAKK